MTTEERLKSSLIVSACLRAAAIAAHPAVVLRKGDPDAGIVLVKTLDRVGNATVYGQTRDADGRPVWRRLTGAAPTPEVEAESRIARESSIDPDIWVVEILDDAHAHPLAPPMLPDGPG